LEPFRGVDPGTPITPSGVIVDVEGGESRVEQLEGTAAQLDAAGFDAETLTTRSSPSSTTLTYGPNGRDAALLLASQLEVVPLVELDEELSGYRVVLSIGDDFGGVRDT